MSAATRKSAPEKNKVKGSVGAYATQCEKCQKWRLIPTKEEFETIRETQLEDPWTCERAPSASCDDPADLEYDNSRIWVVDKPNLPKPPSNTDRYLVLRKDLSKMDAFYVMPNGKKMRSIVEVEKFLESNPEFKALFSASSFSFTVPKVMEVGAPMKNSEPKGLVDGDGHKRKRVADDDA